MSASPRFRRARVSRGFAIRDDRFVASSANREHPAEVVAGFAIAQCRRGAEGSLGVAETGSGLVGESKAVQSR